MYGAILGDIIGSPYEFDQNNIKTTEFDLFSERSEFTDDSIMTLAVAEALMDCGIDADEETMKKALVDAMKKYGKRYPFAGYGVNFSMWIEQEDPKPYNSFGNGSAMRVSAVPWLCQDDIEKMFRIAAVTAAVSHNHPEGIKGAQATAAVIFMAIHGASKQTIRDTISKVFRYDLSRTCDEIRPEYHHVESCQETVPQAIIAFLEGDSFEEVIRLAVSLGGDSDTLTCIAGSMAEAFYGVPENLKREARDRLSDDLRAVLDRFDIQIENDRKAREADPARMEKWKNALLPGGAARQAAGRAAKQAAGGPLPGGARPLPGGQPGRAAVPKFIGSEDIEKRLEELRTDRSREMLIRCFETVRMAMRAGGYVLIPVQPVSVPAAQPGPDQESGAKGADPAKTVLKMKLVSTRDGKLWQVAYSSDRMYKLSMMSGKVTKAPAIAMTIRQALEQFNPETPGTNKAPDNISGIALNPNKDPLFISREIILQILKLEAEARKKTENKDK